MRLECRERAGLCISAGALTAARPLRGGAGRPMGFWGGHLLYGLEPGCWGLLQLSRGAAAPIEPGCGLITAG